MIRKAVYAVLLLGIISNAKGQFTPPHENPKYGPDSASRIICAGNLSTVDGFMKIDLIDRAIDAWKSAFNNCPEASINIYIYGVKIMRYLVENEQDETIKAGYIDTLMLVYDKRIQYFGDKDKLLGRKAIDLIKYRPSEIKEAYSFFLEGAKLCTNGAEEASMLTFMKTTAILYKKGEITADEVLDNYLLIADLLDKKKKVTKNNDKTQLAIDNVERLLVETGAAKCENLVEIFSPQFQETPDNLDLLKKITSLLLKIKCDNTQLFADASEKLYALEPSAESAYNLAKLFINREEYHKSAYYFKKAIELEEDNLKKADYYYQLGLLSSQELGQQSQARSYAYEALNLKENWGQPYLLISRAYATSSSSCGSNKFEKAAVFWAAVDKCIKAKSVDPKISDEANKYIAQFSQYFPNNEDAFFYGYADGQSYTVGCWINEPTTVRTIKK